MLEPTSAVHVILFDFTCIAVFILALKEGLRQPYTYTQKNTCTQIWDHMLPVNEYIYVPIHM